MDSDRIFHTLHASSLVTTPIVDLAPVMFICLLGIFEPEFIRQMHPSLHKVFKLFMLFTYLVAVISMFSWRRLPGAPLFVMGLMCCAIATKVLIDSPSIDSVTGIISQYVKTGLGLALMVYWASTSPKRFFCIAALLSASIGMANLASELLHPNGLFVTGWTHVPCYVYGHKNMVVPTMLPGLICTAAYESVRDGRPRTLTGLYVLLVVANAAFSHSSTALATAVLILGLIVFFKCVRGLSVGPLTVFAGETVCMILLVFLQIQQRFADLIFKIFGKTVTFSSRTEIWANWVVLFDKSPLLGVGNLPQELLRALTKGVNAHESWLCILATGGFVRLGAYLLGAMALSRFLRPVRHDAVVRLGMVALMAFAVVGLMEVLDMNGSLLQMIAVLEGYVVFRRSAKKARAAVDCC